MSMEFPKQTNEQLVTLIKNNENEAENMLQLWQQNQGMIGKIAMQYVRYAELDDLKQEGFIGLCNAVQGYDPGKDVSFISYAIFWIRQAMRRYIDDCCSCVRIPVHMQTKIREYKRIRTEFIKYQGREPADWEMKNLLWMSWEEFEKLQHGLMMSKTRSLDKEVMEENSDNACTLIDFIADPGNLEEEVLNRIEQEEMKTVIWSLVDTLPDQQPELIKSLCANDMSLKNVSKQMGLEYSKARVMRDNAIRTLRRPSNKNILRPYITSRAESMAYRGTLAEFDHTWTSSTERAAFELID